MLLCFRTFDGVDGRRLMNIYAESNLENTAFFYPKLTDKREAVKKVEHDFLNYLKSEFLADGENLLFVWEEQGVWVSALRLYRVGDRRYYIEALETHPAYRRKGYGARLLRGTVEFLKEGGAFCLRSNVSKNNKASLATHKACGFSVVSDCGYNELTQEAEEGCFGMELRREAAKE